MLGGLISPLLSNIFYEEFIRALSLIPLPQSIYSDIPACLALSLPLLIIKAFIIHGTTSHPVTEHHTLTS